MDAISKYYIVQGSEHESKIDMDAISKYSAFWEQTRNYYGPFESTTTMRSVQVLEIL